VRESYAASGDVLDHQLVREWSTASQAGPSIHGLPVGTRSVAGPLAVTGTRARYDRPHIDYPRKPFFDYETAADGVRASATPMRLLTPDLQGNRAAAGPRSLEAYFLIR
jgi:hypothetical protein